MGKPLVLIVEDNKKQSALIAEIIRETGFCEPVLAHDGKQALDIVNKNRGVFSSKIKCILLDWQMPEMNGEQFLKQLRQDEKHTGFIEPQEIPVIIVSAYSDTPHRNFATDVYNGRACGYLVKPFDEYQLTDLLYKVIKEKQGKNLRLSFFNQRIEEITNRRIELLDYFSKRGREPN